MPPEYDNKNTAVLFRNERKEEDRHPDYTGTMWDENNVEHFADCWVREGKKGKFFSIRFKKKTAAKPKIALVDDDPFA